MNPSVMARRAAANPTIDPSRVNSSAFTRSLSPRKALRTGGKGRKAVKLTSTQRNSEGRSSEWNRSMSFWTDSKWSATVGDFS